MAWSLKRQNPDMHEDVVLIRALRFRNLPKFRQQDALLFQVSPLFPFGLLAFLWPLLSQMRILRWEIFPGQHVTLPSLTCSVFILWTLLSQMRIFLRKMWVAFPKESQLQ